jgi:hypothetical protein
VHTRLRDAVGTTNSCWPATHGEATGWHGPMPLVLNVVPIWHGVQTRSLVRVGAAVCPCPGEHEFNTPMQLLAPPLGW